MSTASDAGDEVVEESWRQRLGEQISELDLGGAVVKPNVLLLNKVAKIVVAQTDMATALMIYWIFALSNTGSVIFENRSRIGIWVSQFI